MGPPNKKPAEWRAYKMFSAWDDAKFTIGGALVLLFPLGVIATILWLLFG